MTNKNISTTCTRVAMANKIGRMVTYLDGFLPIKLDDPPNLAGCWLTLRGSYPSYSTLRSRGLSRSRDKLKPLSPLPQYLWPSNLAELWLTFSGSYPYYYTFWLRGLKFVWQTKTYLHCHDAYDHRNLVGVWLTVRVSQMTVELRGLAKLSDKLKSCIIYHNACGY